MKIIDYTRKNMSLINYIFIVYIIVAKFIGPITVQPNGLTHESLDELFDKTEFPKAGDFPMLNRKVFRGMRVSIIEHPYVVSVRRLTSHYLTGTLLTKNLVLTVAHPLNQVSPVELGVVVGENYADRGTSLLTVVFLLFHPDFDPYTLNADLVLLRTYEDIIFKVSIKPISLASWLTSLYGRTAFVTGWGRCDRMGTELCLPNSSRFFRGEKFDPMLRTIKFNMTPSRHCTEYYQHDLKMDNTNLCTGPARVDDILCPCMAVPGAPLVVDARLVAIQSWGFGCGYIRDMPLVYTSLEAYQRWIVQNIPIIRNLTKQNISDLYYAIRINKLTNWLFKSRIRLTIPKTPSFHELQVLHIDTELAKLKGQLIDVRDFIDDGKFHQSKLSMYHYIRQSEFRAEALKEIGMRTRVDGVPFMSNDTLDEAGLVLTNKTLSGDEASDELYKEESDESDDEDDPDKSN